MVFSSLLFLFIYLPITLLLYYITPMKFRNLVLLVVSLIFYGWGEPIYVLIMVFSTFLDYICSRMIGKYRENESKKKIFLIISVIGNLGMLGIFKYLDFFITTIAMIPGLAFLEPIGIALPIGISFYTFQTMSYTIDVYRGVNEPQKNIISLGTYIVMFPQLIAGPIVKYKDISKQLVERTLSVNQFADGVSLFVIGLCKKILIANACGEVFDLYQAMGQNEVTFMGAWISAFAFSFQIYFDFSGYSDMAMGIGKMLGFEFLQNFNYPYISNSISEFWNRWHISLSSWFKEYLYIPLGGNRKGKLITFRNIFIVWLATGAWHGANFNYILWGLFYFVLLMVEKAGLFNALKKSPTIFRLLYVWFFTNIGWVIFANENFGNMIARLKTMFGMSTQFFLREDLFYFNNWLFIFVVAAIASTPFVKNVFNGLSYKVKSLLQMVLIPIGLFLCTASLVDSTFNPFLYFRF